jgi:hypothetical protein
MKRTRRPSLLPRQVTLAADPGKPGAGPARRRRSTGRFWRIGSCVDAGAMTHLCDVSDLLCSSPEPRHTTVAETDYSFCVNPSCCNT